MNQQTSERHNQGGAPAGNDNAATHGLRSEGLRFGLRGAKLPKGCRGVENRGHSLRRQLEAACMDCHGEVNLVMAAHIQTAVRWELHWALSMRWLRTEFDQLSPVDRIRFSESAAKASENRDRAIAKLDLKTGPEDVWAEALRIPLDEPQQPPQHADGEECDADAGEDGEDVSTATSDDQGGDSP